MPIIALMTDFGIQDHYVACMKGVILEINPKATVVDISHDISSQNILHAAFMLRQTLPYFPAKTVFVVVVDPAVGSNRRLLAASYSDRIVLAPDNGILTFLHRDAELQDLRIIENRRFFAVRVSSTFHGRDIFAPVAGHLSKGASLDQLGPPADQIEILNLNQPRINQDGTIDGEIMLTDHFGNLISNISEMDLAAAHSQRRHLEVYLGQHQLGPIRSTYSEAPAGQPLALIGSTQMLEIAVNRGNAAETLGAKPGTPVKVK